MLLIIMFILRKAKSTNLAVTEAKVKHNIDVELS